MSRRNITVAGAAATYIGTVVGAGFASGQEVLQFFALLGPYGLLAIALTAFGFFLFGFAVMDLGRKLQAKSLLPVLKTVSGPFVSPFLDLVSTFFLFGALSAMISGAGSSLQQEFGLPWTIGAILMSVVSAATVLLGFRGVVTAVTAVVPFLMIGVLVVSVATVAVKGLVLRHPPPAYEPVLSSWPWAGLTYISYNLLMAAPLLVALGASLENRRGVIQSSLLGSLGLGLGLLLVYLAVITSFPEILQYEVPMARMASQIHSFGRPFYIAVFLAEVYTTAVANLYGFANRLTSPTSRLFRPAVLLSTLAALWAGSAGFSTLVRFVYPVAGWAGFAFLAALLIYLAKSLFEGA